MAFSSAIARIIALAVAATAFLIGHLLLLNLLREARQLGLETIDLLRGREPYKFKWTSEQQPLAAAEWTTSLRGRVFALARRLRG